MILSQEIYRRTPEEVRSYRTKKIVFGVAVLLPLALISVLNQKSTRQPLAGADVRPIVRPPVVTIDDAMRSDFPLRWAEGGKNKLKRVGKHSMFGVGPANSTVLLYLDDKVVTKARTDAKGRWKAQIRITEPGVKNYRADFRRDGVAAGRSLPLSITLVDPKQKGDGSDVIITNLAPNDRVSAGLFTLRGSAPPGDFVQIYIDSTLIGRAEVDLAGRWSFKPKVVAGGRRTFTVVDEITERQFGPLPIFIAGKKMVAKPKPPAKLPQSVQGTPLR